MTHQAYLLALLLRADTLVDSGMHWWHQLSYSMSSTVSTEMPDHLQVFRLGIYAVHANSVGTSTGQGVVAVLCGLEGSHRSDITLAEPHKLWYVHVWAQNSL